MNYHRALGLYQTYGARPEDINDEQRHHLADALEELARLVRKGTATRGKLKAWPYSSPDAFATARPDRGSTQVRGRGGRAGRTTTCVCPGRHVVRHIRKVGPDSRPRSCPVLLFVSQVGGLPIRKVQPDRTADCPFRGNLSG